LFIRNIECAIRRGEGAKGDRPRGLREGGELKIRGNIGYQAPLKLAAASTLAVTIPLESERKICRADLKQISSNSRGRLERVENREISRFVAARGGAFAACNA